MGADLSALVLYEQMVASPPPASPVPAGLHPAAELLRRAAPDTVLAWKTR